MAKTHSVTKGGALMALVLGATALQNADDLKANVSSVGGVFGEVVCTVAGLTGGIVQLPGGNCVAPAAPAESTGVGG